ncbi:MAG: hypothetical protein AAGC77_01990 [Pseudomonadota bacterium]
MDRILLPLAILAALWIAPLVSVESSDSFLGEGYRTVSGQNVLSGTAECWIGGEYSLSGDCAPRGERQMVGFAIAATAGAAILAALAGVLGILPVIGRLFSIVTLTAGGIAVASMGYLILDRIGSPEGLGGVSWGIYLTGGIGLLTIIAGLSGMRGRD